MLIENTLFGMRNKVDIAIARLREFEPLEGYYLAFSGGKDSVVIKELAKMAGVKFDAYYNLTTVDPPELVRFIKDYHSDVIINKPEETMWELIVIHGVPPTQLMRFCCEKLKEQGGRGRFLIVGNRREESFNRSKQNLVSICETKQKRFLSPIIDWTSRDVWDFIKENSLPYCSLYDDGYKRLGCIMCPMKSRKVKLEEIERWPKYYQNYLKAFDRMLKKREELGKKTVWKTAQEVMDWWIYRTKTIENDSQLSIFV